MSIMKRLFEFKILDVSDGTVTLEIEEFNGNGTSRKETRKLRRGDGISLALESVKVHTHVSELFAPARR